VRESGGIEAGADSDNLLGDSNFAAGKGGHREAFRKRQMYTFYPHIVQKIALSHSGMVRYLGVFVKTFGNEIAIVLKYPTGVIAFK
jgi:hypothetical protein